MDRLEHRAEPAQDEAGAPTLTRRCYPYGMGKRQEKHPFEDNPFLDDFLEWMGSAEGERSGEVADAVWMLLEKADVDAQQRKIIWEDGNRLTIDESMQRIHADHPDLGESLLQALVWMRSGGRPSFAVAPRTAVVQAAYRSRFGHPAPDVVQRYLDRGISVVRTDRCGAWVLKADGTQECQRLAAARYWHHRPRFGLPLLQEPAGPEPAR